MSGIAMGTEYNHFTLDERCRLRGLMEMGLGASEIARRLGRHRGTIYREIGRNRCASGYRPDSADRMAWVRKLRGPKIQRSTRLRDYVGDHLAMGWSPEEIAGRMERDEMNDSISAESIYRYVYSPAGRRAGLARYLAQRKAKRGRRRRNGRQEPSIPNRVSIDQRPAEAETRIAFGHWAGDLMHFRRQQDILLTLHERCSRLTLAERLHSKDAADTADAIIDQLAALPSTALQTITHDNGGEFARHERVKDAIGLRAFFCDPHSPWQRGGIENANGRLRRDLPRKASLSGYSDNDIGSIVWILNTTPRKCLGFRTPIEAFASQIGVALEM
jgi:transposase, IS30 family